MGTTNVLRVQARIQSKTGLPEDIITNTWHFLLNPDVDTDSPADWDLMSSDAVHTYRERAVDLVTDFYFGVRNIYSGDFLVDGVEFRSYTLATPQPREPVIDARPAISWSTSDNVLPREVAICMSYRSLVPGPSGRGRLYLGPLTMGALVQDPLRADMKPSDAVRTVVCDLAKTLAEDITDVRWSVWSPTRGEASIISSGFVDDAVDIQRRRGGAPASRTTWERVLPA